MADALAGAAARVHDPVQRLGYGRRGAVRHCALSPDGETALVIDSALRVCDVRTGRFSEASANPAVIGMAAGANRRRALVWTARDLYAWDYSSRALTRLTRGQPDHHLDAAAELSEGWTACAHREPAGAFLEVYRSVRQRVSMVYRSEPREAATLWIQAFGRRSFACGLSSGAIELWTISESGAPAQRSLEGHSGSVLHGVVVADQSRLVTASTDLTIRLWAIDEQSEPARAAGAVIEGHSDEITDLVVTPDGRLLATASRDRTIRIWSNPEGRLIKALVDHQDWVTRLAVNPAGTHMASCSTDGTIKLWDLARLECVGTAYGVSRFLCLAMSADTICAGDAAGNFWMLVYGPGETQPPSSVQRTMLGARMQELQISRDKLVANGNIPLPLRTTSLADIDAEIESAKKELKTLGADEVVARRHFVSGRVQGVGFRFFVQTTAARLGIRGYVRNLSDGRVEVYAIGSEGQLADLKAALLSGPAGANVANVDEEASPLLEQEGFSVQ